MVSEVQHYMYKAHDELATEHLASQLAEYCWPGMVIGIDGELGAGKTRFTQAFATCLGVEGVVNSPTFTLIKEYMGKHLPLYHMDVYRLSYEEADELGLDEYFYGEGVCVVEWASRLEDLLPPERLDMVISHDNERGPQARRVMIRPIGAPYVALCEQLRTNGVLL